MQCHPSGCCNLGDRRSVLAEFDEHCAATTTITRALGFDGGDLPPVLVGGGVIRSRDVHHNTIV
jgi:hypothetical protein